MSYITQNNNKIVNAFAKSKERIEKAIQIGLEDLLEWGMYECLNSHDTKHQNHLEMGDAYGWILFHNGSEVKRFVTAYQMYNASANQALDEIAPQLAGNGWHGAILASMQPRSYFVKREEIKFMNMAINHLKQQDFDTYFRAL